MSPPHPSTPNAPNSLETPATPAILVLENGSVYHGSLVGKPGTTAGEIVFNTASTGYQEILTDPSYCGQIVMMTYPEIGNYGVNPDDVESESTHVSGFVVRRMSRRTSSWRATQSFNDYLVQEGITAIEGVDTRAITRNIRSEGAMKAGITSELHKYNPESFLEWVRQQPSLEEQDLVGRVTPKEAYTLPGTSDTPEIPRLVVMDFGIKQNILRCMQPLVGELVVVPAHTDYNTLMSYNPSGVFLSNGPGDPGVLTQPIETARQLIEHNVPTFGICLGHQILALAAGAKVEKMPFGHHGGNHPVLDIPQNKITITSQNHGYAIVPDGFDPEEIEVTHKNLNDQSIEGIRHKHKPVSSVQFHPEANPGPHDARYLFDQFIEDIGKAGKVTV